MWADRIPDRLSAKGITAEKIATACVQTLLNHSEEQPKEIYAYIGWLFRFYGSFEIKYEGYSDLWATASRNANCCKRLRTPTTRAQR